MQPMGTEQESSVHACPSSQSTGDATHVPLALHASTVQASLVPHAVPLGANPHTEGAPEHTWQASTWQSASHPSPATWLLSSQVSPASMIPLPHVLRVAVMSNVTPGQLVAPMKL